jgi:RNA polymerase sigma-70 factor (ECF subfamily)
MLLAEAAWLRRLAFSLAGNKDDAEDLVQDSWIAAWKQQPDTNRPLRPWLSKVVRDLSKMGRRGRQRREVREASVADTGEVSAPDVLVGQMRLHRLLVDRVLELEEPYRSTVVARFVEGKTAAAIARSLDIPESTVRWRLREALVRLRAGLDEKTGTRKAWAPAVLAFGRKGVVVAKSTKTIVVVVALIALILGGFVFEVVRHSTGDGSSKEKPVVLVGRPRSGRRTGTDHGSAWSRDDEFQRSGYRRFLTIGA